MRTITLSAHDGETLTGHLPESWAEVPHFSSARIRHHAFERELVLTESSMSKRSTEYKQPFAAQEKMESSVLLY